MPQIQEVKTKARVANLANHLSSTKQGSIAPMVPRMTKPALHQIPKNFVLSFLLLKTIGIALFTAKKALSIKSILFCTTPREKAAPQAWLNIGMEMAPV